MPRTKRPIGAGKRYPLNVRTTKETRERLEAAAAASGRSLVQELEARLERSFETDDRFGGQAMLPIVNMLAGAFLRGGQLAARARQHPEWTAAEWLADPYCYRAAAYAVADALNLPMPTSASTSDPAAVHELLTSMVARGAPLAAKKGSDK